MATCHEIGGLPRHRRRVFERLLEQCCSFCTVSTLDEEFSLLSKPARDHEHAPIHDHEHAHTTAHRVPAQSDDNDALEHERVRIGDFEFSLLSMGNAPFAAEFSSPESDQTGLARWPASNLLTHTLLRYGRFAMRSTDVLDLGCGTGIAGLAAAACCNPRSVVLSDREPRAQALASRNAALQPASIRGECAITVAAYGWAVGDPRPAKAGRFGLILASECLYAAFDAMRSYDKWGPRYDDGQALARFLALVDYCLAPGGIMLIAFELRNCCDQARAEAALAQAGFHHESLSAEEYVMSDASTALSKCDAVVLRCRRMAEVAVLRDESSDESRLVVEAS